MMNIVSLSIESNPLLGLYGPSSKSYLILTSVFLNLKDHFDLLKTWTKWLNFKSDWRFLRASSYGFCSRNTFKDFYYLISRLLRAFEDSFWSHNDFLLLKPLTTLKNVAFTWNVNQFQPLSTLTIITEPIERFYLGPLVACTTLSDSGPMNRLLK